MYQPKYLLASQAEYVSESAQGVELHSIFSLLGASRLTPSVWTGRTLQSNPRPSSVSTVLEQLHGQSQTFQGNLKFCWRADSC